MECCAKIYVRVYRSWRNARVLAEFPRGTASVRRDDSQGRKGRETQRNTIEKDAYEKMIDAEEAKT